MFDYLAMAYKGSEYTIIIAVVCCNSPWCWSYECFCLPIGCSVAQTLAWMFIGSTALRKGPQK